MGGFALTSCRVVFKRFPLNVYQGDGEMHPSPSGILYKPKMMGVHPLAEQKVRVDIA
jgi:hypothetical protein